MLILRYNKISYDDVSVFVDKLCEQIASEVDMLPKKVKRVFKAQNKLFFSLKNSYFWDNVFPLKSEDARVTYLKNAIRVPDLQRTKVQRCKALYEELSETDKLEFLVGEMELLK